MCGATGVLALVHARLPTINERMHMTYKLGFLLLLSSFLRSLVILIAGGSVGAPSSRGGSQS